MSRLLVVTGGRDRHQDREDALWLRAWCLALWADALAHGDCHHRCDDRACRRRSIDRWAGVCGLRLGLRVEAHRARWDLHGNAAGPIRNIEMLDLGPVAVLAFPPDASIAQTRCEQPDARAFLQDVLAELAERACDER